MGLESDRYSLFDVEATTVESDAFQSETTSNSDTEKQLKSIQVIKSSTTKSKYSTSVTITKLLITCCVSVMIGLALGFGIIALFKIELFQPKDGRIFSTNHNPDHANRPLKILASYKDFVENKAFQSKLNNLSGITFVRLIKDQNDSEQKNDLGEREVLGSWDDVDSINKAIDEKGIHKISLGTAEWSGPDQIAYKNLYTVPTMGPIRNISKIEDWNNIANKKLLMDSEFIKKSPLIKSDSESAEPTSDHVFGLSAKAKEMVIPDFPNGIKDILEKINSDTSNETAVSAFPIMAKPQEAMGGYMNIKGQENLNDFISEEVATNYVRLENLKDLKNFCRDRYIHQYLMLPVNAGGKGMNKDEAEQLVPAVDDIDLNIEPLSNKSHEELKANPLDIDRVMYDMISYMNKSFLFAHFVSSSYEDSLFWLVDENGKIVKWAQKRFELHNADNIVHTSGYKSSEWIITSLDHLDQSGIQESVQVKGHMNEILRALNYRGIGCSDVRYENSDFTKPRLLEINPRLCFSLAGKDDGAEWVREWVLQK